VNEQWEQVKELFVACSDLTGDQLAARLAAAPGEIRREVESLLAAEKKAGPFLGGWPNVTRIGPYELIAKIGEGGMGAVWEARRADGQFEQRVAIKIVRQHYDSEANLERFRAERQLLAQLDHPNICRLLDGGTTTGGLPYLVMELIEGSRIDEYCSRLALTAEQRLRLLLPVCDAVAYANRSGVLHRDLKPANILVTAAGVPKLVDFGIAKAIGPESPVTATIQRIATPEYASPEHLSGKSLTATSDVYSLGVTAYELLTGAKPYSGSAGSLDELVRTIGESAPPPPSSFGKAISADIDKILARAMHKDPDRRYAGSGEMAKDIERHLTGEPVLARGDSITYRLGRILRLNRGMAVAAAAAFALGVIAWNAWFYWHTPTFTHRSLAVIGIRSELTDPSLQWLERGVVETLTTSLLHSGAFQVIPTERVRANSHNRTPEETARSLGTDLYVDGVLRSAQDRIRLDLRVHETGTRRTVFARGFESVAKEAVFLLADQGASQIAGGLTTAAPARTELKMLLTQNIDALRSYEEARRELGKWHIGEAIRGFRKAVELDPEFTMAYVGLAGSVGLMDRSAARGVIVRAAGLAASRNLQGYPAKLIQGLRLYFDGRLEDSAQMLRALAEEYPQETDPLLWEGMAHTYAFRVAEARVAFGQVTRLDPDHAFGWLMLAQSSGMEGAHETAQSAAARYCRLVGERERNCYGVWGDIYVLAERWDDALEQYQKISGPSSLPFAVVHWLRGDSLAASRYLSSHNAPSAHAALVEANAAVARGDFAGAPQLYEKSAKLYRNPHHAYLQLLKAAEIWLELGKPENIRVRDLRMAICEFSFFAALV